LKYTFVLLNAYDLIKIYFKLLIVFKTIICPYQSYQSDCRLWCRCSTESLFRFQWSFAKIHYSH